MPSCSPTASPAPSPISSVSAARQLLARLALPEPWQGTLEASLRLIDELDREIGDCERELRRLGADHRYLPLLCTVPGISWVLADTIAAELGDIDHFPTPRKLAGYTGLCPRVYQSGERALRGPLAKQGPRYLRWALVEDVPVGVECHRGRVACLPSHVDDRAPLGDQQRDERVPQVVWTNVGPALLCRRPGRRRDDASSSSRRRATDCLRVPVPHPQLRQL